MEDSWGSGMVDQDDVVQEYYLAKLKDPEKTISAKVIKLYLSTKEFGPVVDEDLSEMVVADFGPLSVTEQLWSWALSQKEEVRDVVREFLKDPEAKLGWAVNELMGLGVEFRGELEPTKKKSTKRRPRYSAVLRSQLQSRPTTFDELVEVLQPFGIRRPQATVRAFLRREKKKGLLKLNNYDQYVYTRVARGSK